MTLVTKIHICYLERKSAAHAMLQDGTKLRWQIYSTVEAFQAKNKAMPIYLGDKLDLCALLCFTCPLRLAEGISRCIFWCKVDHLGKWQMDHCSTSKVQSV